MGSLDCQINDKIFIQESGNGIGYGAFVKDKVEKDEVLFTVPRSACVTLDDAMNDAKCGKAFEAIMEKAGPGGNTVVLAGYLAKEYLVYLASDPWTTVEDSSTKFGPYLETLPWTRGTNQQEHVLFWSQDDAQNGLAGTFCYDEAMALRAEVDLAGKVMNGIIGPSILLARGDWPDEGGLWPWTKRKVEGPVDGVDEAIRGAFVSLLTRSFEDNSGSEVDENGFDNDGDDSEKLVPLLDMLQHSDEPNISHKMRLSDQTVEVRARRAIEAGEELMNQYRSEEDVSMPYHRFFTRFGFVPGIVEPVENLLKDESSILFPKLAEV